MFVHQLFTCIQDGCSCLRIDSKWEDLPKWFTNSVGEKDTCSRWRQLWATKAGFVPLSFFWLLFTGCQLSSLHGTCMAHSPQRSCHSNPQGLGRFEGGQSERKYLECNYFWRISTPPVISPQTLVLFLTTKMDFINPCLFLPGLSRSAASSWKRLKRSICWPFHGT